MPVLRKMITAGLLTALASAGYAQTIFTYGNRPVTRPEFLKAYNKNNTEEKPTEKSYREYLELYTRFKLKVQAALDLKLDTLSQQKTELAAFRSQVVESYMNDDGSVNILVSEAIERGKKDIHLAHIFIPVKEDAPEDEVKNAELKAKLAYGLLQQGNDFGKTAEQHSQDPAVKQNKGDLGYITVFTLPYDLETLAYTTPAGKVSPPFRSRIGFHIFKNLGERKAVGKMKAAQILLSYPPDATDAQQKVTARLADSLYKVLQQKGDFKELAARFSNDNLTYQAGGEMQEFGVGRYAPAFEAAAFALSKDGEVSKPVATEYGWHIIKRLQHTAVPEKEDKNWREEIRQQVLQNDRMNVSRKLLYKNILQQTGYKKNKFNEQQLWQFSDSILQHKPAPKLSELNAGTVLFSFAKQSVKLPEWQQHLEAMDRLENMKGKTSAQLFDQFTETKAFDYYRDHLEEYNKDFAAQLQEFREGNLLFEVMQRTIWDKAAADSNALKAYYEKTKDQYWWEASADAIIFTAANETIAEDTKKKIAKDPSIWKSLIDSSEGVLQGDSGRFELGQIPVVERTNFTPGLITASVKNDADNSFTFAYIVKVHSNREPRTFPDARGFVINNYQQFLEEKWISELKEKYPIKVNEPVVRTLAK